MVLSLLSQLKRFISLIFGAIDVAAIQMEIACIYEDSAGSCLMVIVGVDIACLLEQIEGLTADR